MTKLAVHKVLVNAPIQTVWEKLVDWENWTKWDKGMKSIRFKGPLTLESRGKINLGPGMSATLIVTEWTPETFYKSEFKIFGSRFLFEHQLEPAATFTLVTFRIEAEGAFADFMHLYLAAKFGEALPQWMDNFKQLVERGKVDPVLRRQNSSVEIE